MILKITNQKSQITYGITSRQFRFTPNWRYPQLFARFPICQKRHQQYGPIFKTSIFGQPTVFVRGQEASLFVLTNDNQYFVATFPPSMKTLLGPLSLALQTGANHQNRRKLLYQALR